MVVLATEGKTAAEGEPWGMGEDNVEGQIW